MKALLIFVSLAGLGLTIVPSFLVMMQRIPWTLHVQLMFVGMILWFGTAPFWIKTD